MSDWIQLATTFIGVALGIPVGLWLNKKASEFQHRQEEEQARQRKLAILKALIAEVKHNQDLLNQMEGELKIDVQLRGDFPAAKKMITPAVICRVLEI